MGRTGRGSEGGGKALLFLFEHELGFIRFLKLKKVQMPLSCELILNELIFFTYQANNFIKEVLT